MVSKGAAVALAIGAVAAVTAVAVVSAKTPPGSGPVASLVLTSSTTSVAVNSPMTLTVTATDASNKPVPGAVISVYEGTVKVGSFPATGANGMATETIEFASAGTYQVSAQYP